MEFITIFFTVMSVVVLGYLFKIFKSNKRLPIILELFYVGAYGFVFTVFLYPNILTIIENILGIQSAINFVVYLSIFVSYLIIFLLYTNKEKQREEITKLTREIAYLKDEKRK
ncbi:MAG: DUF2304 domain-containing protein [Candidatus Woesearchaeota archaeon]|jgi:hypothetical protein|nr:DUF2304 domain-containing protein [Candidatus Woesearchaeota archaeon]